MTRRGRALRGRLPAAAARGVAPTAPAAAAAPAAGDGGLRGTGLASEFCGDSNERCGAHFAGAAPKRQLCEHRLCTGSIGSCSILPTAVCLM